MNLNLDLLHRQIKPLDLSAPPPRHEAVVEYFRYYGINLEEKFEQVYHYFGRFHSGHYDIVTHYFKNKNAVATCFIVHGYFDHSGLYGHLIEYCLKRNYSVVIADLPGHGLSSGEQGSISSFESYQNFVDDLLAQFKTEATQPFYALGQSTGAAILAEYLLRHGDKIFEKSVFLAPLLYPVKWGLSRFHHSIAKCFVKRVKRHFAENSGDKDFVNFVKHEDPLQMRYLSVQWVTALRDWIKHFLQLPPCEHLPLIIQGRKDGTVAWKKNMVIYEQKFPKMKTMYLQNGHHHLVNDSEGVRENLYAAMDVYFDESGKGANAK